MSPGRLRLLVVDDSRATQVIICRALEAARLGPIDIEAAGNGEQALVSMETFAPQLVISDVHMPGMSGMELLRRIRQQRRENLAVGLATREADPELLKQARSNGGAFVLRKPFRDEDLVERVRDALGCRQVRLRGVAELVATQGGHRSRKCPDSSRHI